MGVLKCALWLSVDEIVISGDSNVTIDWAMGSLTMFSLCHWLDQISTLIMEFLRCLG